MERTIINRLADRLRRLADKQPSARAYRSACLSLLAEMVPFDGGCLTGVDGDTGLSTGSVTDMVVEAIHPRLFEYEYRGEDFNRYEALAAAEPPAAALSLSTGGRPELSERYRDILSPAGFGDELRAVLIARGRRCGQLSLLRRQDHPPFTEDDVRRVAALLPQMAAYLRQAPGSEDEAELSAGVQPAPLPSEAGVFVLSDRLDLLAASPSAEDWLAVLRGAERIEPDIVPRPVRAVCTRALSPPRPGGSPAENAARVCVPVPGGFYIGIRASRMESLSGGVQLAVTVERARPADILPVLAESFGLTEREREVVDRIVHGLSSKEAALSLCVSEYTLQDHLKSVFRKTGTKSRRELVWQLYSRFS
ncbi:helix-turn-helix transcriptional regulator [Saccharibacillus sp. CPCC 101409]|uniref:helix-turn-helix transcriptional regulator n=1 Tax=Saccharibacillus sp. CPCC 101409 TaxID=3058041 RepID=UPI0026738655|nr:helix-turn-helix transcriptional regulator [Saccharibacillus sp. CPCC 101409]MDO3411944.1 helix-turn-helix transcriptional regulator [Saccharibacillus sp. CPCC 101409]